MPLVIVSAQSFFVPLRTEPVPLGFSPFDAVTLALKTTICSCPYSAYGVDTASNVLVGVSGALAAQAHGVKAAARTMGAMTASAKRRRTP